MAKLCEKEEEEEDGDGGDGNIDKAEDKDIGKGDDDIGKGDDDIADGDETSPPPDPTPGLPAEESLDFIKYNLKVSITL